MKFQTFSFYTNINCNLDRSNKNFNKALHSNFLYKIKITFFYFSVTKFNDTYSIFYLP